LDKVAVKMGVVQVEKVNDQMGACIGILLDRISVSSVPQI